MAQMVTEAAAQIRHGNQMLRMPSARLAAGEMGFAISAASVQRTGVVEVVQTFCFHDFGSVLNRFVVADQSAYAQRVCQAMNWLYHLAYMRIQTLVFRDNLSAEGDSCDSADVAHCQGTVGLHHVVGIPVYRTDFWSLAAQFALELVEAVRSAMAYLPYLSTFGLREVAEAGYLRLQEQYRAEGLGRDHYCDAAGIESLAIAD